MPDFLQQSGLPYSFPINPAYQFMPQLPMIPQQQGQQPFMFPLPTSIFGAPLLTPIMTPKTSLDQSQPPPLINVGHFFTEPLSQQTRATETRATGTLQIQICICRIDGVSS